MGMEGFNAAENSGYKHWGSVVFFFFFLHLQMNAWLLWVDAYASN